MKNKKTAKTTIVVAMLLAVSLYFIAGTYARYTSEYKGGAAVDVAKWNVALKNGEDEKSEKLALKLEPTENSLVVNGKIAPSMTATGKVVVDLTDTEVAVEIAALIAEKDYKDIFGGAKAELTVKVNGTTADLTTEDWKTINLPNNAKFTENNGQVEVEVSLKWVNAEANNTNDTTTGATGGTLTIPVTLKVRQKISQ